MLVEINGEEQFNEFLKTDKPVMIDFYAVWCGPCKMAMPQIEHLAETHAEYAVAKVNIDDNPELAEKFQIMKIPAFRFFKNGELVDQMPPGDIRRRIMEEKLAGLKDA